MGASVAGRRTRILVMTSEVELMRLVRSVLEPSGCLVSSDGHSGAGAKADGPFDIVVLDLPGLDLDRLRHDKRAYPDAHFIVICGSYREADCIAVLDLDADYLPRPFRAEDLRRGCAWPNCDASTRPRAGAITDTARSSSTSSIAESPRRASGSRSLHQKCES